jgi:hypothetical protein
VLGVLVIPGSVLGDTVAWSPKMDLSRTAPADPPISAGWNGMQIETICRYKLSNLVIVFNNGSVNRGDDVNNLLG